MEKLYIVVEVYDSGWAKEADGGYEKDVGIFFNKEEAIESCYTKNLSAEPLLNYTVEEHGVLK